MDADDRAVAWAARRRRRNFLISGVAMGVIAVVALVATLLGFYWAAGFLGGALAIAVSMLALWRGERRIARDDCRPSP
ncbi:hypothetical protein [Amnibacterium kyonggiense]